MYIPKDVIKCTRPSADENTPTRNYNLRSMRAWRREKRPGFEATPDAQLRNGFTLRALVLWSGRAINMSSL